VARSKLRLLLLALISAVAWGLVVLGSFQYDDITTIVRDASTRGGAALVERLLTGVRPLTRLSYFLDAELFGLAPRAFLATNLALHIAAVLLVQSLALRRLFDGRAAFVAAAVFALQPAHAATIAYASGRSEGLSAVLVLMGLVLWEQRRTALSLSVFALACLARETALVFPFLLWVWEATRPASESPLKRPFPRAGLAAAAAVATLMVLVLSALARYRTLAGFSLGLRSPLATLFVNGRALPITLSLWVRPWTLSVDHSFAPEGSVLLSCLGLVFLAGLTAGAILARRRAPFFALAVLWALVCLAPTCSWIARLDFVTERPLYLAWVGPALLFGRMAQLLFEHASARIATAVTAVALSLGGTFCMERAWTWSDPIRLWQDATAKAPRCARCWNNLGMAYFARELDPQAADAFRKASLLDPDDARADANLEMVELLCGARCY
jgi:protein O-mannosyl-transferase